MAKRLELGVCYYPEHWPEAIWREDLRRMKDHGLETVRVGEFAWSLFEPREGEFDFSLFDRFCDLAAAEGVKVIFGTPTATPPAWVTENYPETLNASADGQLYRHGLRRHYTYNSPKYRELTVKIVRALGERFGHHPAVVGWQIDNELNCETDEFRSEADHAAFREFLKAQFGTLEALNAATGGNVWSQNYTEWSQVHLRRHTIGEQFNPHMLLLEKRFFSESAVSYCRLQCDTLRPLIGDAFITTNGIFGNLDYTRLVGGALDFLDYDSYPNFALDMYSGGKNDLFRDRRWGRHLDEVRALSPKFGIMEQQSGANGWTGRMEAPMPRPGQMRLWTMQSVAHGADFVSYFRWRTAPYGTEIYWHGLNDYDNLDNRRLAELRQIRDDFKKLAPLARQPYRARIAYVRDYDNEWDAGVDQWHGRVARQSLEGVWQGAQLEHEPMDFLFVNADTPDAALAKYQLLIYPHPVILDDGIAEKLKRFMEKGGQVLFAARTGYKDAYGRCPMRPMGFAAAELCGVRIEDYTFVGPEDEASLAEMDGEQMEMAVFNDILLPTAPDARVEAVYIRNYYEGKPAVVSRPVGKGRAWYYGAAFTARAARRMLRKLGFGEPWEKAIKLPGELELAVRGKYLIVLNYHRTDRQAIVETPMRELLSGEVLGGAHRIEPFGVWVFEMEE